MQEREPWLLPFAPEPADVRLVSAILESVASKCDLDIDMALSTANRVAQSLMHLACAVESEFVEGIDCTVAINGYSVWVYFPDKTSNNS